MATWYDPLLTVIQPVIHIIKGAVVCVIFLALVCVCMCVCVFVKKL